MQSVLWKPLGKLPVFSYKADPLDWGQAGKKNQQGTLYMGLVLGQGA